MFVCVFVCGLAHQFDGVYVCLFCLLGCLLACDGVGKYACVLLRCVVCLVGEFVLLSGPPGGLFVCLYVCPPVWLFAC